MTSIYLYVSMNISLYWLLISLIAAIAHCCMFRLLPSALGNNMNNLFQWIIDSTDMFEFGSVLNSLVKKSIHIHKCFVPSITAIVKVVGRDLYLNIALTLQCYYFFIYFILRSINTIKFITRIDSISRKPVFKLNIFVCDFWTCCSLISIISNDIR